MNGADTGSGPGRASFFHRSAMLMVVLVLLSFPLAYYLPVLRAASIWGDQHRARLEAGICGKQAIHEPLRLLTGDRQLGPFSELVQRV